MHRCGSMRHGHNNKYLNKVIKKQLNKIAHSTLRGSSNIPSIELAEKLIEITPSNLRKVFYSDTGSASVEIAIKMAYQYWKNIDREKYAKKKKFYNAKSRLSWGYDWCGKCWWYQRPFIKYLKT